VATAQTAICPEPSEFGIFITFTVKDPSRLRPLLAAIPGLAAKAGVLSVIAIGPEAWQAIFGSAKPDGLVPFTAIGKAPATRADLFLHLRSGQHYANFAAARIIVAMLGDKVEIVEEVHGFKNKESRDLTGFVDGTENPKGDEIAEVALTSGGSYVHIQRYVTDLAAWEQLSTAQQEAHIGRTKQDDVEMDETVKPPTAHIARVVIEENGEELAILRRSLPYGTTSEAGLYFVAYGASPAPFRKMLKAMFVADRDGHYDHLTNYTKAVTGAAFFAPSVEFLAG
jgi:putative iron-dependent peroxidase